MSDEKDRRLYFTVPLDFTRHPKVTRLPVEVRWTFIEMLSEARTADNDGRFEAVDAEFMWPVEHLRALVGSHPLRPLVAREGERYVLREYAKHQFTRADRERLAEVSRENGRKGGRPRKNPETQTKPSGLGKEPRHNPGEPRHNHSQSQSQSQSQRETTYVSESQSLDNRAREMTDELSAVQKQMAAQNGLDPERVRDKLDAQLGIAVTLVNALAVGMHICSKPKDWPRTPTAYVLTSITRNPAEIEKHIYDAGLA